MLALKLPDQSISAPSHSVNALQAVHGRLNVQLQMKEKPVPAALTAVRKTGSQVACIHKSSADQGRLTKIPYAVGQLDSAGSARSLPVVLSNAELVYLHNGSTAA